MKSAGGLLGEERIRGATSTPASAAALRKASALEVFRVVRRGSQCSEPMSGARCYFLRTAIIGSAADTVTVAVESASSSSRLRTSPWNDAAESGSISWNPVGRPIRSRMAMNGSGSSSSTFTIVFASQRPSAISMAAATGGTPGGVADALRLHFGVGLGVIGHLVDEHLPRLAVLGALDDVADARLAGVAGGQALRVGQHGLDHLQRDRLATTGELTGSCDSRPSVRSTVNTLM